MAGAARRLDTESGVCQGVEPSVGREGRFDKPPSVYSPDVFVNDLPAVRQGDFGSTLCPLSVDFQVEEGSPDVFVNDLPKARLGDRTRCLSCGVQGEVTSASSDVVVN